MDDYRYKPKKGDIYWTYYEDWEVVDLVWQDRFINFCALGVGAVFRTSEEAENARPKIYKILTGNEWNKTFCGGG